jgi:hypothetical protein
MVSATLEADIVDRWALLDFAHASVLVADRAAV